jgi:uncharacterized protein (UPF0333 family)
VIVIVIVVVVVVISIVYVKMKNLSQENSRQTAQKNDTTTMILLTSRGRTR